MSITKIGIARPGAPYQSDFTNLRGGINTSLSDELIRPDELSDARNYIPEFLSAGMIVKREGITRHLANQQTEAGTSVYQGKIANFFTTSSTIKTFVSNTNLDGTLSSTTAPDWTSMGGIDIYVNGTNAPRKVTAGPTVAALGGTPPTFKYIQAYHNFVFGAGHSTGKLRWSDVGTTETWTSTNELPITNDENDDISGLTKYRDMLIVFCDKSFHHVSGFATLEMYVAYSSFEEGCTSHRSIVPTPYGLFWWSKAGLCRSNDGFSIDYVMTRKDPNILSLLNKSVYSSIHGTWHPRLKRVQYYVAVTGSTTADLAIYYYPEDDSLWLQSGAGIQMGASGFAVISGIADVYTVSASTTGYLFKNDGDTDDGTAISGFIETKRDATEFGIMAWKRAEILAPLIQTSGNVTMTYSVILNDNDAPSRSWSIPITTTSAFILDVSQLDVGILGGPLGVAVDFEIGFSKMFRKIKHRIADDSTIRTRIRGVSNRGFLITA